MKLQIIFIFIFVLTCCKLFERDERVLTKHILPDGSFINISYVGTGATTNDVIQILTRTTPNNYRVLKSYDHNFLEKSELINDSMLRVIMTDTGFHNYKRAFDTVIVNIK